MQSRFLARFGPRIRLGAAACAFALAALVTDAGAQEVWVGDGAPAGLSGAYAPGAYPGNFAPPPPPLGPVERILGATKSVDFEFFSVMEGTTPSGPVIVDQFPSLEPRVSAADLQGSYGVGTRGAFKFQTSPTLAFEGVYFGILDWDRNVKALGNGDLELAGLISLGTVAFFGADEFDLEYDTDVHNFELNVLHSFVPGGGSFVIGVRSIDWNEQLSIVPKNQSTGVTGEMLVKTENSMLGGQVGFNQSFYCCGGTAAVRVRGALFEADRTHQTTINDPGFVFPSVLVSEEGTASLQELGLSYSVSAFSSTEIRLGYNLMWVQGLARAPAQVDLTDTPDSRTTIDGDGDIFLHGPSMGAKFTW